MTIQKKVKKKAKTMAMKNKKKNVVVASYGRSVMRVFHLFDDAKVCMVKEL
jgi:hypothetical protein